MQREGGRYIVNEDGEAELVERTAPPQESQQTPGQAAEDIVTEEVGTDENP